MSAPIGVWRSPGRIGLGPAAIVAVAVVILCALPGAAQEADTTEVDRVPEGFIDVRAGVVVIEEVVTEGDLPRAGFEPGPVNGAFLQSADGTFRLQFGAFTQVRWTANWRDAPEPVAGEPQEEDFTRGWSLNRTQIFFEGKYTENAAYHFRAHVNDSFDPELLVAWAQMGLGDGWSLRVGKHFMPLSREDWMLAHDLLATEFSTTNSTFAIGTSLGAWASYRGDRHRFWLGLHNGAFGGRETFPSPETDLASTIRWEWNFVGDDWNVWRDVVGRPGRAKVMMLGLSAAYQSKQTDISTLNDEGAQLNLDLNFNGDGYQVVLAGSTTWRDPVDGDSFTNYGLMAQGGYFVANRSQVFAQYSLAHPGNQPDSPTGNLKTFNSLSAGFNYFPYLWTNRWKLSAEAGYLFSALNRTIVKPSGSAGWLASDEPGQAYLKLQMQFGF